MAPTADVLRAPASPYNKRGGLSPPAASLSLLQRYLPTQASIFSSSSSSISGVRSGGMAESGPPAAGGKILRRSNSDRLRMHAPSSIQVAPPTGCASEWKVAIPLLSPLDICTLPGQIEVAAAEKLRQVPGSGDAPVAADLRRSAWRHPAEPFYYEPAPGNAPAFAVSHGAS